MLEFGWGLTSLLTPVLYAVALLVIVLTAVWRIEIGVYFLAFFLPLQNMLDYVKEYPLGEDINDLLLLAMLIRWAATRREPEEPFLQAAPVNLPVLLFFLWTGMEMLRGAAFLGLGLPTSLQHPLLVAWKNYWMPGLFFLIILNTIKRPEQIKVLVMVTLLALLMLDRNFYNVLSQHEVEHYSDSLKEKFLTGGAALSGNALAVFMAQYGVIFLALGLCDTHKLRRLAFLFTTGLTYYCVMFLFSRGGYLAAIASLFFLGAARERRLLVLLVFLCVSYQTLLPTPVVERINMTKTETGYDVTAQERLGMWEQAREMIAASPLLGWGFSISPFIEVRAGAGFGDRTWGSFHNNFLQTTVEIGLIGIALLLCIYFYGMWLGLKLYAASTDPFFKGIGVGFSASVAGILAGNINGSYWHFFTVSSFFWIYLAITMRLLLNLGMAAAPAPLADRSREEAPGDAHPGHIVQPA